MDNFNTASKDTPFEQREKETAQVDFHDGMAARLFEAEEIRGSGPGLLAATFTGIVTDS